MCLGVTAASFYEIYEWVVDNWFGQHLFIAEGDTVNDLADGFLGAAIGGLFLAAWAEFRYTSRRFPRAHGAHPRRTVGRHVCRRSAQMDGIGEQPEPAADTRLDAVRAGIGDREIEFRGVSLIGSGDRCGGP